jgi:hypothetical protein
LHQISQQPQIVPIWLRHKIPDSLADEGASALSVRKMREIRIASAGLLPPLLGSRRQQSAAGLQDTPEVRQPAAHHVVEDNVVALGALRKVLPGVIDDLIRSERTYQDEKPPAVRIRNRRSPSSVRSIHFEDALVLSGRLDRARPVSTMCGGRSPGRPLRRAYSGRRVGPEVQNVSRRDAVDLNWSLRQQQVPGYGSGR